MTPSEACVEYAIAVEAVREQTRIMRNNRCGEESRGEVLGSGYRVGEQMSCLNQHWTMTTDGQGRTVNELPYEEMCALCKVRLEAFETRRDLKRRLGAAKRSIEAVGKREIRLVTAEGKDRG